MNDKGSQKLSRFKNLIENHQINSIPPEDPLFVIRYISKNNDYLHTLNALVAHDFGLISSFVHDLETKIWNLDMIAHIEVSYPRHSFNNGFDLAYVAYLSELISRELFYDFVVFQSSVQNFSGLSTRFRDHSNVMVQVAPLPKAGNITRHVSKRGSDVQSPVIAEYIEKVKHTLIESGMFCFSNEEFLNCLLEPLQYSLFEIEMNYSLFQSMTSIAPHVIWFDLFLNSTKYALVHTKINANENKISMFIPGEVLLNAFVVGISPESRSVFKRVYAFGLISIAEELRLHQKGYHLASLLDLRFKSLVRLHGRTGNSWECLLHDNLFHSVAISSHPEYIRHTFIKIYDRLNTITQPQSELLGLIDDLKNTEINLDHDSLISQQLLIAVLNELKSRCVDLGDIFIRRSQDYKIPEYYFKKNLIALLIGTTYQMVSQQVETLLEPLILEKQVKRILVGCCLYLNKNPITDVPTISHELLQQFFLSVIFKGDVIMKKNTVLLFAEKEIVRLQVELEQVKTQKTLLQKPGQAKNKITDFVENEITRLEKEVGEVEKQIEMLTELAQDNEESEQVTIPTPGVTSIFAKEPSSSSSTSYRIIRSPNMQD